VKFNPAEYFFDRERRVGRNIVSVENADWAAAIMKPVIAANERDCRKVRVEIKRRGTDWAAEEIVNLLRQLAARRRAKQPNSLKR
jgi:hypothetical protein